MEFDTAQGLLAGLDTLLEQLQREARGSRLEVRIKENTYHANIIEDDPVEPGEAPAEEAAEQARIEEGEGETVPDVGLEGFELQGDLPIEKTDSCIAQIGAIPSSIDFDRMILGLHVTMRDKCPIPRMIKINLPPASRMLVYRRVFECVENNQALNMVIEMTEFRGGKRRYSYVHS